MSKRRPLLHPEPTRRSLQNKARRTGRTRSGGSGKERNGVRTPRLLATTPLTPQKKRKRTEIVIPVESRVITVAKKTILQISAPSQKTSVSLGNLRAND